MFDSSLPYITTERNSALIFDYNLKYKWDFILFELHLFILLNILKFIALTSRNEIIIMDISHQKTDTNVDSLNAYEICLTDAW